VIPFPAGVAAGWVLRPSGSPNALDVRYRFGSALPNFQDLADSGSVRTDGTTVVSSSRQDR